MSKTCFVVGLIALGCARPALCSSCDGLVGTPDLARKKAWESSLATQLHSASVEVRRAFQLEGWAVVQAGIADSDEAFLFFSGDPASTKYVTLWAGAATRSEENEILKWTKVNAKGIPQRLARCFAWYVTKGRE